MISQSLVVLFFQYRNISISTVSGLHDICFFGNKAVVECILLMSRYYFCSFYVC